MFETGPGQRLSLVAVRSLELALDLPQVPTHPVDAAVDIGGGETPGLADLPDQQEGEQLVVLAQRIDGSRDPGAAFVEIHLRPDVVLATGELDGRNRLVVIDQRRAGDRRAVDGIDVVPRDPDAAPLPTGEVPQAVRVERLGRGLRAAPVGLPPRGSRLQLQRHGDTSSQDDLCLEQSAFGYGEQEIVFPTARGRGPEVPGSSHEPVSEISTRVDESLTESFRTGRRFDGQSIRRGSVQARRQAESTSPNCGSDDLGPPLLAGRDTRRAAGRRVQFSCKRPPLLERGSRPA